jgi:hypothetical protein
MYPLFKYATNMKDTHEANLPTEDVEELEETEATAIAPESAEEKMPVEENIAAGPEAATEPEVTAEPEAEAETVITAEPEAAELVPAYVAEEPASVTNAKPATKEEILNKLTDLLNSPTEAVRNEVDLLKQAFYKIHRLEVDELKKTFLENGGEEQDFQAPEDETEAKIKELLQNYKEKRATLHAEEEQTKAANYALKLQLIARMKELTESQDDFNKLYNEFKEIQVRWKEAKAVPQEYANELWKNYQIYSERFYDLIKINNQLRDYDFKKNLELKTTLCEAVEKLEIEADVISAFHQLQKLHQQWREIGPVTKDLRESLWGRFKTASAVVRKRHQEHFEGVKSKEHDNLAAKIALCEIMERIDYSLLKSFKDWETKSKEVIALQEQWKHIGFAPKKQNVKIFERFRSSCDSFFRLKGEYYRVMKGDMDKNLELKTALCEQAEAIKDSTDWKVTTDKMIALQKEWKAIGTVPRKYSEPIWKRFIAACDYFFEQKNQSTSSQKTTEVLNLAAKKDLIDKINNIDTSLTYDQALELIKDTMAEWNSVGFVPFKEKEKVFKEFRQAIDNQFDRLKVDQSDRKMQSFRSNLTDMAAGEKGTGKLYGEREKLLRTYERMKTELQTYENNIGFFNVSSKGGGGLLKEMQSKIAKIKEDMALIVKKIEAIDENLE